MSLPRALRVISEEAPPRPRSRNRAVPVDLETIALKAIEKAKRQTRAMFGLKVIII